MPYLSFEIQTTLHTGSVFQVTSIPNSEVQDQDPDIGLDFLPFSYV